MFRIESYKSLTLRIRDEQKNTVTVCFCRRSNSSGDIIRRLNFFVADRYPRCSSPYLRKAGDPMAMRLVTGANGC
ncbi:MAG: hypothetical protein ACKVG0_10660, partial [Alphaproteobacteria bacterium]